MVTGIGYLKYIYGLDRHTSYGTELGSSYATVQTTIFYLIKKKQFKCSMQLAVRNASHYFAVIFDKVKPAFNIQVTV
jgi:hypothetical protein